MHREDIHAQKKIVFCGAEEDVSGVYEWMLKNKPRYKNPNPTRCL